MATYGDQYLFTFEVKSGRAAANTFARVASSANQATVAIQALATAWTALNAAMGATPPSRINIQNSQIGSNVMGNANVGGAAASGTNARAGVGTGSGSSRTGGDQQGFAAHIARHAVFAAEAMAIYAAYQAVTGAASDWLAAQRTVNRQMLEFQLYTNGGTRELIAYREELTRISALTGVDMAEVGPSLVIQERVTGAPSDLARRAAEAQMMTGADNYGATRDLLSLSKQFPNMQTVEILDAFMGALSESSLNAEEFFAMLESAGPLTRQFNTNIETTLGMFAGLSTAAGESGASIELFMRQMERVYTEPSTRGIVEQLTGTPTITVDPNTGADIRRPIDEIFREISQLTQAQQQQIAETIPNMLGQQTRQLFLNMVHDWQAVEEAITSSMQGGGSWDAGFQRMSQSFDTEIAKMETAWQRFLASKGNAQIVVKVVAQVTEWMNEAATRQEVQNLWDQLNAESGMGSEERRAKLEGYKRRYIEETGESPSQNIFGSTATVRGGLGGLLTDRNLDQRALKTEALAAYRRYMTEDLAGLGAPNMTRIPWSTAGISWGRFGQAGPPYTPVPAQAGLPKYDQTLKLPEGASYADFQAMYASIYQQRLAGARATMPGYAGMSDNVLAGQLGIGAQETFMAVNELGVALGPLSVNADVAGAAIDALNERIKSSADVYGKALTIPGNRDAYTLGGSRSQLSQAEKLYQQRANAVMSSAISYDPGLTGKTRAEVLAFAGISEEYVTLVDDQGNVLRRVMVDLGLFASALEEVGIKARQLEYMDVPEGWSSGRFFSELSTRSAGNLALQEQFGALNEPPSWHYISTPSGTAPVWGNSESIGQADASISTQVSREQRYAAEADARAKEQIALLKRIDQGIQDFAAGLLQATPVTEVQMAQAKLGTYGDQWDEPVRRVRDVVERRKRMDPNLGPWQDYAAGLGVDSSSIEAAIASGAEFERKFYNGLLDPAFYEANSKDAFIAAARGKLEEKQGQERLTAQARGWLDEAGISGQVGDMLAREFSGEMSPVESYWRGGKTDKELQDDLSVLGVSSSGGITKGVEAGLKDAKPVDIFVAAFDLKGDGTQAALRELGRGAGALMVDGMAEAVKDRLVSTIVDRVVAQLVDDQS